MIILLGGTGFLGKHLCILLNSKGIPAITISRNPDTNFLEKNCPGIKPYTLNKDLIAEKKMFREATTVVHLASNSIPSSASNTVQHELDTSIQSTLSILDAIIDTNKNIHLIFMSSGGTIYGPNHSEPISETSPTNPTTPYAFGKIVIEKYIKYLSNACELNHTILRIANPVGKWHSNPKQGFIGAALEKQCNNEPVIIYGDGDVVRDYIDADEVAGAILMILENPKLSKNKTWNIGTGKGHNLNNVVEKISRVTKTNISVNYLPSRPVDLPYNVLNCSSIMDELGWSVSLTLDDIIVKLLRP